MFPWAYGKRCSRGLHKRLDEMPEQTDRAVRPRRGPLAGIRVADFCWMGVGSVATRLLADFGAEVIKIEDRIRIDTPRAAADLQGRAGPQLR